MLDAKGRMLGFCRGGMMWRVIFHVQGLQKSSDFSDSLIRRSWELIITLCRQFCWLYIPLTCRLLHIPGVYISMVQCWWPPIPFVLGISGDTIKK